MILCPNCNHQNPSGAVQCEACYTPLPSTTACPSCGATVQMGTSFCGQCGSNLKPAAAPPIMSPVSDPQPDFPIDGALDESPVPSSWQPIFPPLTADPLVLPDPFEADPLPSPGLESEAKTTARGLTTPTHPPAPSEPRTQIQMSSARLLHLQTDAVVEIPPGLSVVHIGKPNDLVPPDVDMAGFPNSEIVSRIHADIRVEGDSYFLEDVGSSNGTYVNNAPLPMGNRHRLRSGDRIALGKGDKVSFLFQIT